MNGSFDAKICHTDVKFHSVEQNNVKRNLSIIRCVHLLNSSLMVEVLFLEMEPPAKRRIHRPCFQDSRKTGRRGETAPGTCVLGSNPVEKVAPGTHVPGCLTILEQTLVCVGVYPIDFQISGS